MGKEEDVHVVRLEGTWNEEGRVRGSSDVGGGESSQSGRLEHDLVGLP